MSGQDGKLERYVVIHNACGQRIGQVESLAKPLPDDLRCPACGNYASGKLIRSPDECTFRRNEAGNADDH